MKSPISLEHTIEEINSILTALAAKPYAEVAELIHKIKNKAEAQIVEAAKAVEEEFTPPADQPPQA
jgi:HPt (histidine-containing phosphotransfer) domain-containing protein